MLKRSTATPKSVTEALVASWKPMAQVAVLQALISKEKLWAAPPVLPEMDWRVVPVVKASPPAVL